jgi:hypothetical protein
MPIVSILKILLDGNLAWRIPDIKFFLRAVVRNWLGGFSDYLRRPIISRMSGIRKRMTKIIATQANNLLLGWGNS